MIIFCFMKNVTKKALRLVQSAAQKRNSRIPYNSSFIFTMSNDNGH